MKKLTVMLLIAAMVLGVSACGNSANKENTATESQMSTQEAEDLDAKINELTQKENSILENHKALWEKVFNSMTSQLSRMRQLRITEIFWQTL